LTSAVSPPAISLVVGGYGTGVSVTSSNLLDSFIKQYARSVDGDGDSIVGVGVVAEFAADVKPPAISLVVGGYGAGVTGASRNLLNGFTRNVDGDGDT
jgi:hypothetical protein